MKGTNWEYSDLTHAIEVEDKLALETKTLVGIKTPLGTTSITL
jgi:hypothetical protein